MAYNEVLDVKGVLLTQVTQNQQIMSPLPLRLCYLPRPNSNYDKNHEYKVCHQVIDNPSLHNSSLPITYLSKPKTFLRTGTNCAPHSSECDLSVAWVWNDFITLSVHLARPLLPLQDSILLEHNHIYSFMDYLFSVVYAFLPQ